MTIINNIGLHDLKEVGDKVIVSTVKREKS